MSAHTPGPWHASSSGEGQPLNRIGYAMRGVGGGYDSRCIALLSVSERDDEVVSANARLMAAAPELLANLKKLLAVCVAMDAEQDNERPDEADYQAAIVSAARVIKAAELE
jgi:hypothetical protein